MILSCINNILYNKIPNQLDMKNFNLDFLLKYHKNYFKRIYKQINHSDYIEHDIFDNDMQNIQIIADNNLHEFVIEKIEENIKLMSLKKMKIISQCIK